VSDEKLWDESPTSRHLQVLYHQTSFQVFLYGLSFVKIVSIFNIQIVIKGAHLNFAMGATLHRYAAGSHSETSMALIEEVVGDVTAPDDSAKLSSHFHMHGSHFLSVVCLVFPFVLALAVVACM